jgi:hypothetical protein
MSKPKLCSNGLFQPQKDGEDPFYALTRDAPFAEARKERIERLWNKYEPLAPRRFRDKLQIEFYQRWWEMCVGVGLCNLSMPLVTNKRDSGPDFRVDTDEGRVWVEAVAPGPGTESDAVPPPLFSGVADVPMRECLLRLTQGMEGKLKQAEKHAEDGVILSGDPYVIAISSCRLNFHGWSLNFPQPIMLRILAGAGDLVISPISQPSKYSARQALVSRDSRAPVDLALFESDRFARVSAVLYSALDPLVPDGGDYPEGSFEMFLNPQRSVDVPPAVTSRIPTWSQTRSEGGHVEWERIDLTKQLKTDSS